MVNFEAEETENIFREECKKILDDFENQLNVFEKTSDIDIIIKLMRDAHSIKGSAGIVGLKQVQTLAHKTEDLLAELKDNPNTKSVFIELRKYIKEIEVLIFSENNISCNIEEALNKLIQKIPLLKNDISVAKDLFNISSLTVSNTQYADIFEGLNNIFRRLCSATSIKDKNLVNVLTGAVKTLKKCICNSGSKHNSDELIFVKQRLAIVEQMVDTLHFDDKKELKNDSTPAHESKQKPEIQNIFTNISQSPIKTLRIETDKLDKLCENIADLGTLSKKSNEDFQKISDIIYTFSAKIFEFEKIAAEINTVSKEKFLSETFSLNNLCTNMFQTLEGMQKLAKDFETVNKNHVKIKDDFIIRYSAIRQAVKNIRNLPIGVILHMLPRVVRDIADTENKEVEIKITGGETSVDKKILEEIKMPLIHLLRNAVDHGIEAPEIRKTIGKSQAGQISVHAKNVGNKIIISVKDDGCGIDFDKIKAKALQKKLLEQKEINNFEKPDFINILFKPGFSTEDKVTEISGRGFGLDIVYSKISELKGNILINTENGKGTEIILEIPSSDFIPELKNDILKYPYKIMVVDDSATATMYLKTLLQKAGFDINTFKNAKDAYSELEKNKYDLLISDVEMPHINGVEFAGMVRKNTKLKNLPIIIISMLPKQKLSELFKSFLVNDFISKSDFNEQNFIKSVKTILEKNDE
ncbi:MAG: response regulator [Candidatus Gastranaerophilaceae bacterium]